MNSFVALLIASSFCHIASSCTLPSYVEGTWESPGKGTVVFNSTHLTGYDVYTYTGLTFECHLSDGAKYVLRSDEFTVLGNSVNAAICLTFKKQSSGKVTYFILTSELADVDYERVMFVASYRTDVTVSEVCDSESVANTPQETKLLIADGQYMSETVNCPNDILGTYWYYDNTSCSESYWDVCDSRDTMTFNYTLCSEVQAFSANATVYCMYQTKTNTKGEYMVYVYNADDTVDDTATFRFTCMVVDKMKDKLVYVTQYPGACYANQSSTYVPGSGTTIVLSANVTCVPSSNDDSVASAGLIAGLVILFLVLIVAGAVGGYYIYMKKFKKIDPDDKRIIDKEKNDGDRSLDPVTPSVVNAEMQDMKSPRNGTSHGKLQQVLGPEYTMTANASDDAKTSGSMPVEPLEMEDVESPRKLPPIMTGNTPRDQLSPLDTQLKKPTLPAIP